VKKKKGLGMFQHSSTARKYAIPGLLFFLIFGYFLPLYAATCPAYDALVGGPQQIRFLPGQKGIVFSMYGAPGELDTFRELVEVMRKEGLGNGFDPVPGAVSFSAARHQLYRRDWLAPGRVSRR
jgi:hypothetical protein